MIHVNTWYRGELIAAYTTDDELPEGAVIGRQGNAVLFRDGDFEHVVSRPRVDGDILDVVLDVIPEAAGAPEVDLSGYFA